MGNPVTNLDEANAEITRTSGYDSDPSGQMCQDFIQVCRWILMRRPENSLVSQRADTRVQSQFNMDVVLEEQRQAIRWLANLRSSQVAPKRSFDLSGVRNDG